ncbi:MAG: hypothetical protein HPY71_15740 [Firmicutes bacterium]|nr:hypothetical protein [Bacillota bacterium]
MLKRHTYPVRGLHPYYAHAYPCPAYRIHIIAAQTTAALLALVVALAAIALCPGGLGGSSSAEAASIAINPARIEQVAKDGDKLTPIAISNRGSSKVLVRVSVEEGGHDLNGMLISRPLPRQVPAIRGADGMAGELVRITAGPPRAGEPAHASGVSAHGDGPAHPNTPTLVVEPEHFTLGPGETRFVSGVINIPRGFRGGFYPVVVFECSDIRPGDGDKGDKINSPNAKNDARGDFSPISRVAAITLLTVAGFREAGGKPGGPGEPGAPGEPDRPDRSDGPDRPGGLNWPGGSGEITAVNITQDYAGAPVTIVYTFKNTGNIHAVPAGSVIVSTVDGTNLASIPLEPAVVLPGYSRNLTARWCPDTLAAGEYFIYPRIMVAAKQITGPRTAFTVIRPYELARLAGEIVELKINRGVSLDGEPAPAVSALFHNSGNLDFKPRTIVEIYSRGEPGGEPGAPPRLIRRKEIGSREQSPVIPAGGSYPIECSLMELLPAGSPDPPATPPGIESYTAVVTILGGDRVVAAAKVDFKLRGNEIALASSSPSLPLSPLSSSSSSPPPGSSSSSLLSSSSSGTSSGKAL